MQVYNLKQHQCTIDMEFATHLKYLDEVGENVVYLQIHSTLMLSVPVYLSLIEFVTKQQAIIYLEADEHCKRTHRTLQL